MTLKSLFAVNDEGGYGLTLNSYPNLAGSNSFLSPDWLAADDDPKISFT